MGCDANTYLRNSDVIGFNPRTRMGCDLTARPAVDRSACFNPRTRMGCDRRLPSAMRPLYVSIHAPAWGATFGGIDENAVVVRFQSTHPHGVRRSIVPTFQNVGCFNPRTRMGCDRRPGGRIDRDICFNPRTRMGCDPPVLFY